MTERTPNRRRPAGWRPKTTRGAKNRRRASPLLVVGRGALAALAGYALWTTFHAPALAVRSVEVVGADRLGAVRVARLAGVPLGVNLFRVNLYRARLAVERDPLVASATVSRALPNMVRVVVRERCPVFVVAYAGQLFEADGEGVLFRPILKPTPRLPVLQLTNVGMVRLGAHLPVGVLKPALTCLALAARDRMLVWKIKVDGLHELWLNMKASSSSGSTPRIGPEAKNLQVRMGRPEDLALKMTHLRQILVGRPRLIADAHYLDLSCAGYPVYMAQTPTSTTAVSARGGVAGLPAVPAVPVSR